MLCLPQIKRVAGRLAKMMTSVKVALSMIIPVLIQMSVSWTMVPLRENCPWEQTLVFPLLPKNVNLESKSVSFHLLFLWNDQCKPLKYDIKLVSGIWYWAKNQLYYCIKQVPNNDIWILIGLVISELLQVSAFRLMFYRG